MKLAKLTLTLAALGMLMLMAAFTALSAEEIEIRFASWDPPLVLDTEKTNGNFGSTNIKAQVFKQVIEASSNGRIKVTIMPNGQIGGDKEAFEMMQAGALDMSAYPGSIIANFVPEAFCYQIPFLFRDSTVANQVMDGPFGRELADLVLQKTGVRIFRWGTETWMDYMTNGKKKIHTPADLEGLKMRVLPQKNYVEMVELLGASPTPVPFSELYTALQQGVVDGTMTPISVVEMFKLDQGVKYIFNADVSYLIGVVAASDLFWQKLSDEDKKLVADAANQASEVHRAMQLYAKGLFVESLRKKGTEVVVATPEEKAQFKAVLYEPMVKWTRGVAGDEWVDKVLKAVSEVEARLYR